MTSYLENTITSMETLRNAAKQCDFSAVRLSASTMRLLDSALINKEITDDNYYIMIDRIGIISDDIINNCTCSKKHTKT